jgi:hypothetical protein
MQVKAKLSGVIEGALAAGGDPATSPLYVFGPFLRLIVPAGVAAITFGASIWLAVLTVVTVSAVYRLVMQWVPDGTGGSGLSEEEFGPWAGKMNAGITFVEYLLTFLVSMAALVTFLADRFAGIETNIGGVELRALIAIGLSAVIAVLVNGGPRVVSATFGPATAGVLLLLCSLIVASLWRSGLDLPRLQIAAFTGEYLPFTLGGYARILALMTGIEVFANLVGAYSGTSQERGRKAFGSLAVVMGTTSLTMLIVGPAILELADPTRQDVSVFTQAMDALLPAPLAYLGTLTGVAVLLSACATAAQGIQYLALGLSHRHYVPRVLGQQNNYGVADRPVWSTLAVVTLCFLAFGTQEETYLALYAAGVFVLLSMTAWAAARRLARELRIRPGARQTGLLVAVGIAAMLTTSATVVIFWERLFEGAWLYFLVVPLLFLFMTQVRRTLGDPSPEEDCLGQCIICSSPCLGPVCARENARRRLAKHSERVPDGSPLGSVQLAEKTRGSAHE